MAPAAFCGSAFVPRLRTQLLGGASLQTAADAPRTARRIACCARDAPDDQQGVVSRRALLTTSVGALIAIGVGESLGPRPVVAAQSLFKDERFFFEFAPPPASGGWKESETTISGGRVVHAWVLENASEKISGNITAVSTPIPADYRKLTSFGTQANVADTIMPPNRGLDGTMKEMSSVQISVEGATESAWLFDYELTPPGGKMNRKHLWTLFSLKPGSWIVSVTAQADAGDVASEKAVQSAFEGLVKTFKIT
ncbi:hypothetical protein FVE85_7627 [Porphyridium purpureum]|uniref:PsbP C-terminal domain-containing protein n=1 Tax=Porphyridium purpureum TaxID=35688 RepID=A0A5J4ZAH7_PORPP|nr:hypothetical protein FVE85_7627 [Porphyridium purpureum]|eukprot:POR3424..scf295_1